MPTFADPRANPSDSANRASPRLTESSEELTEVYRFCRGNRLYDVERWIQVDRPLQLSKGSGRSPTPHAFGP
jgi:hypothetical protein